MSDDGFKRAAASAAVERYVEDGMVVGLGTGSTATFAVRRIGELVSSGELKDVRGVPTSARTTALANELGIPLATLSEARPYLTIDGTDEVSPDLTLIKGRGGALLREKIVASSSEEGLIVVADSTKMVDSLGAGPLPVEIDTFGWEITLQALAALGCEPELRMDWTDPDRPFVTDGGHYTADCKFDPIPDPASLEVEIKQIPGALECGLFVNLARAAIISGKNGTKAIEAKPR
ncbi:Ribose 5-phosphate isomerase A [uncultured Rubrobacteraceae bacterium]|uniref:Ribose-5-phosphate isomerase A n=1 Tax=uncultured Rubrobacteraceae bacterium TaxID=349277 RepID=A0A6J4P1K0_9ACTN|nr:Ribose 5-phosphate isomerase A [uncultured Rubrobacteraceae bacterium]